MGIAETPAVKPFAAAIAALLLIAGCASVRPVSGGSVASAEAITYLTEIRRSAGLTAPAPEARLEEAALEQARLMAGASKMVHTTGRGRDFASRMRAHGIAAGAENIAHGRMGMAELFGRWRDSPPHRRNMLDPRFSRFGLASAADAEGTRYWALVLGP